MRCKYTVKKVAERIHIAVWQAVVRLRSARSRGPSGPVHAWRMAMAQRRVSCHASRLVVILATTHVYMYVPPIIYYF